ncbi:ABC transporter permease [uncultured Methanolobus sp.]|uniref:ABC transporter permease n=1 Tax=uncultured Methanolobus sp. TaxID=218300 RepID=UPI002AAC4712|nr:ABC transporter permease [uncultured Methanolobus sp.]
MKNVLKKVSRYFFSILAIITLNFTLPRVMPGDPVMNMIGEDTYVTENTLISLRNELGLDRPLTIQYADYLWNLLHFDLGYSYHLHVPVSEVICSRMLWTMLLVGISIIIGAIIGTCAGAVVGWNSGTLKSRIMTVIVMSISCTPPYFLALMALYIFVFRLGIFPFKGFYDTFTVASVIHHMILPVSVMSLFSASRNFMVMRGSVIQEKEQLYALYAKAKGLQHNQVLLRHVFRNACLPIITQIALDFGFIFSGALFIEIVFSLNGLGTLIYDAVMGRDYPVLQGAFLLISFSVILGNMAADILYSIADPRVRRDI